MPNEYESPIGQRPEITGAVVPPVPRHDPYAAFRSRGFRFFTTGNLLSILGRQMLAVAVEWEIYRRTHSATALGLVGLVFAIPIVGMSLPAGHLADRISRKRIIRVAQILNAVTWNNTVFQIGSVVGPTISGFVVAHRGFPIVYVIDTITSSLFFLLVLPIPRAKQALKRAEQSTWRSLAAGAKFVFSKKVILATITLDLFAVLLGGAVALLPIFADQILHCGPVGLGWMRASPAIGAFAIALIVAYLPPMREAGKILLWCVTGFGIATVVFGLSKALWLSMGMLFVAGSLDSVSVIIRGSIVQLVTPDEMRGRVSAVNNIFIGTSNEFGALESGLTAALFGPVISVVAGGIGTILVVAVSAWRWPEIRKIGALDRNLR